MDIPLAINYIGIRTGFKGYRRRSSMFNPLVDVDGLSALFVKGLYWAAIEIPLKMNNVFRCYGGNFATA